MRPGKGEAAINPDGFHVGFFVGKPEMVHAKPVEFAGAGLGPGQVQELTRGGAKSTTFYCHAPGGILVKISAFDA